VSLLITFFIQTTLSVAVLVLCLYKYKRRPLYIRLMGLVFIVSFLANFGGFALYHLGLGRYTNIPQSAYDPIVLPIISLVFYHALNQRFGRIFFVIAIGFVCFSIVNMMGLQKEAINSYHKFVSSFFITCYCVFYFYRLMVELPATHLQRIPMFWFTSGFLIYHAGTIFLFAFTAYLTDVLKNNLVAYWVFHNILSIIMHLIIVVGAFYDLSSLKRRSDHYAV